MIRAALVFLAVAVAAAAPALARVPETRAELLPGWRMEDGRHMAAVRLTLPPGWKTYWRSPGAAGIPPQADMSRSRGISRAEILWPAPKLFRSFGMLTIGYEGVVVLPIAVTPSGGPAHLDLRLGFGICEEICVPMSVHLSGALPSAGRPDPAIRAALADVPARHSGIARCGLGELYGRPALVAELRIPSLGRGESVAVEMPGARLGEPQVRREGGVLTATFPVNAGAISRSGLHVTAFGPAGAVDQAGCRPSEGRAPFRAAWRCES